MKEVSEAMYRQQGWQPARVTLSPDPVGDCCFGGDVEHSDGSLSVACFGNIPLTHPITVMLYLWCLFSSPMPSFSHSVPRFFPFIQLDVLPHDFLPLLSFKFLHPLLVSKRKPSLTERLVLWWERLAGTSASHTRKHS